MQTLLDQPYDFFLETDLDNYKGEWVAICDTSVLSHGKNLKNVVEEAKRKCDNKKFLLAKIPSGETMIF